MLNRRHFLGALGLPAALCTTGLKPHASAGALAAAAGAMDEETYWAEIARAFTVDRSLTNFNNGGVSPAPAFVQDAMQQHLEHSNEEPAHVLWKILEPRKEIVRQRLARQWGVDTEEIALTRNASEGLQICQFGFDLKAGDHVLASNQEYPRMITTFKQRERREGIRLQQFSIPTPAEDTAELVRLYESNITPETKLILLSHMIFLTGQIMPVAEIVAMARTHGIPVIVDGAHAFAHFDFKLSDLDCDYYATSLHKWLFAPHGTGLLYVRRDKIRGLWPLMAAADAASDDIRKFEEIGTHPAANGLAVAEALTFHQGVGAVRKQERLIALRNRWAERLLLHSNVRLHTSLQPGRAAGIANVEIVGVAPNLLTKHLWDKYRVHVSPINHAEFCGVRVSPSIYSTLEEIDRFVEAMEQVVQNGLPA